MNCKRLNPEVAKVPDRGKKQVIDAKALTRVGNHTSSSATLRYVQVVPPPAASPSAATHTVVPPPTAIIPNDNITAAVPQPSNATSHETVPHNDAAGPTPNNLQDFSAPIPQGILPRLTIPVLEVAEHADVQLSSEIAPLPVNRNNNVQTLPTHLVFSVEHGKDYDDDDDDDVDDDVDIMLDEDNIAATASKDANASIPLDLAAAHMPSQAMPLSVTNPFDGSLDGDVEHDISIQDGTLVSICLLCYKHAESSTHLFLECEFARNIWIWLGLKLQRSISLVSFAALLDCVPQRCSSQIRDVMVASVVHTVYSIWLARNALIFNSAKVSVHATFTKISSFISMSSTISKGHCVASDVDILNNLFITPIHIRVRDIIPVV